MTVKLINMNTYIIVFGISLTILAVKVVNVIKLVFMNHSREYVGVIVPSISALDAKEMKRFNVKK